MGRSSTYYCEVSKTREDIKPGVYSMEAETGVNHLWYPELNRLVTVSDRVWKQGPKGGVRIVKEPFPGPSYYGCKYLTTNPQAMKEFAWVKLKAKPYDHFYS